MSKKTSIGASRQPGGATNINSNHQEAPSGKKMTPKETGSTKFGGNFDGKGRKGFPKKSGNM